MSLGTTQFDSAATILAGSPGQQTVGGSSQSQRN
eukprot:CAMPEP_0171092912 /NCGR_PEP_ID=MMETSP0766_2-20121228/38046_1 /TAXON_ID=439317 /ORGANISM="Gambierdiscus australes, Strain CAWD 149" /LENGTH=33 /DNA_ID= /DNA_START= /DNA_END= /DNA_ORIENTATION=